MSDIAMPRVADLGGTARKLAALEGVRKGDAEHAAKKLESLFATMLVREMRRAVPEGFCGQGSGADVYEGGLAEHGGEALARDGALNLAGMVKTQLGFERAAHRAKESE